MGDLRIGAATAPPNFSELKLGSENIQKVYSGSTLVWPVVDPSDETIPFTSICNIDFTIENSTKTLLQDGSTIPIVTTASQWNNYLSLNQPAAVWWQFNSSNSNRGLFYNTFAFDGSNPIQPPSGWRIPTYADWNNLTTTTSCTPNSPNQNIHGANTGLWDMTYITNSTGLGDSGLNVLGNGYGGYSSGSSNILWLDDGRQTSFGLPTNPNSHAAFGFQSNGTNLIGTVSNNADSGYNLRFCR